MTLGGTLTDLMALARMTLVPRTEAASGTGLAGEVRGCAGGLGREQQRVERDSMRLLRDGGTHWNSWSVRGMFGSSSWFRRDCSVLLVAERRSIKPPGLTCFTCLRKLLVSSVRLAKKRKKT